MFADEETEIHCQFFRFSSNFQAQSLRPFSAGVGSLSLSFQPKHPAAVKSAFALVPEVKKASEAMAQLSGKMHWNPLVMSALGVEAGRAACMPCLCHPCILGIPCSSQRLLQTVCPGHVHFHRAPVSSALYSNPAQPSHPSQAASCSRNAP